MSGQVFISHSEKDKPDVNLLLAALESHGIRCWIAPRDIPPGGSYADAILTAIESSTCFVLVYSAHCNDSRHVLREVERALNLNINIVPVRFDDSKPSRSLDYLLATLHWLSVPSKDRSRALQVVASQIAKCASSPKTPSASSESPSQSLASQAPARVKSSLPPIAIWTALGLLGIGVVITFLLMSRNTNRTDSASPAASAAATPAQSASKPIAIRSPTADQPWVIPESSVRRLELQDVYGLSKDILWRARNEIYARHGFIFSSVRGQQFTESLGKHYQPVDRIESRVLSKMNDIERDNIILLRELENPPPEP
jgi:TIR domain/YARHG domain